jgi:hypothetical protein
LILLSFFFLYIFQPLPLFAWAALANAPVWAPHAINLYSSVLEVRKPKIEVQQAWFSVTALFLVCRQSPSCALTWQRAEKGRMFHCLFLEVCKSHQKGSTVMNSATSHRPSQPHHTGYGVSLCEFMGTHIQSITSSLGICCFDTFQEVLR